MPVVREADPSLEGKQIDKDGRSQGRDARRYSGADIIWAVGLKVQGRRERHSSGLADQEQARKYLPRGYICSSLHSLCEGWWRLLF